MKKIAVITMARNDNFFLEKWINYYAQEFGKENLFVFLDGDDQPQPTNIGNATLIVKQHQQLSRAKGDKYRINLLSDFAEQLFNKHGYDLVIGTDCDEFLAVDPACNTDLASYVDVGHHLDKEGKLDPHRSILAQRHYAVLSSRYTKACIISRPVRWGSGFHRVKGKNFHIDPHLFLFHIGYCDIDILADKADSKRINDDWQQHLKRRAKTIQLVTDKVAQDGDLCFRSAHTMQTYCRPIFAWNKPSMLGRNLVIKIPQRFHNIFI